ncbi:protocadherin gamma-B2-like [Acomys russatus]|uniref:protocadherin gamma-B2-like n=1 Tax=Acomys russatus TaxID=60746 RepID=UPI0021E348C2|nr:protocadherin gamma-B2-like [Acomys russatus]
METFTATSWEMKMTDKILDREKVPEYNVTIVATDRGKPPLFSKEIISLHISDVNDNAPVFHQASYLVHVAENNPPGTSIAQVSASDPDLGSNGHVSYSIIASDLEPRILSSFVSVNQDSGVLFAQRAFDHEQLRSFQLTLQARDQGSPALSTNVSMRVLVGDRNDNAPRVLYPALEPDGSALFDMVPRAAEPGYLVTKVVAVDADSGHNAWLSYHVLQASDPGLFSLGLRTGEVRTARALGDRDSARQRLLVAVRDGGQPPLSATATLHLIFADSLQEVLPDLRDDPLPPDPQSELQFYLVVALALISVLFLLAVILAIALRLRGSPSSAAWGCFQPALSSNPVAGVLPNYSEGTLPYSYNVCIASQSAKTEFNFLNVTPEVAPQDLLCDDASWVPGTLGDTEVPFVSDSTSKSFDYEHLRDLQLLVTATDSGNPPLSSNVSLSLFVLDQNDNVPEILYPAIPTDGSTGVELAPRSAEPGYLVTKVVAVDKDSGQNAWLSYRLIKASEPGLFSVGLHTGEVRTARALLDRDSLKQNLMVAVQDHGQPPLSATVTLTIAIGDSIPDVLTDLGSNSTPTEPQPSDLTLYLVISVAVVSFVFLGFVTVLLALRLRHWHMSRLLQTSTARLARMPTSHFVGMDGVQAYLQTYSHEISLTTDSKNSHLIFPQPNYADRLISEESCEKSEPLLIPDNIHANKEEPGDVQQNYLRTLNLSEYHKEISANREPATEQVLQTPKIAQYGMENIPRPGHGRAAAYGISSLMCSA